MTPRERLMVALRAFSYHTGDFQLSAGGRSNVLIDASKTLRRGDIFSLLVDLIGPLLPETVHGVGGPSLGADPLAAAAIVARPDLYWFSFRRAPKGHGLDEGALTGPMRRGDRIVLVEDVITTGASTLRAADGCVAAGLKIVKVIAAVDREQGGVQEIVHKLDVPVLTLVQRSEIEAIED